MKQSLLLLGSVFAGSMTLFAQHTPVSTSPQNKNAVLEELTGIHCGYCPDGHLIANNIAAANPGRVVLVNIHAGGYATPGAGEPDLRTTDGTALDGFFNPTGYPAGSVQRYPHSSDMTRISTGRGNWTGQVNAVLAEASPANVAMDATIDATTRELTLHVEVLYTTPQASGTTHYLNIGMLQNDFEAIQSNYGNYNPTAILPNGKYLHQHIFRGYLNTGGTWGQAVDASIGTVQTFTVTYTLPANINAVDLNIGKLQFFAILHPGHNAVTTSKIITAAEIAPDYTNVPVATANANSVLNTFNVCDGGSIVPVIKVTNDGAEINSIEFSTSVNGGTAVPFTYNGTIDQFGSAEITLPSMVVNDQGTNNVVVTITSVNGGAGNIGTTSATKPISIASVAMGTAGVVKMTTDRYGSETTWKLFNSANTVVAQGGPYTDAAATGAYPQADVNVTLVPNECYRAVVYDSYGDGFDSGYGNGDFKVQVNGTSVATVATFSAGSSMEDAMKVDGSASIEDASAAIAMNVYPNPATSSVNVNFEAKGGEYSVSILDLAGRVVATQVVSNATGSTVVEMPVSALQAGNYFVSVANNGSTYTQKLIVE